MNDAENKSPFNTPPLYRWASLRLGKNWPLFPQTDVVKVRSSLVDNIVYERTPE